MPQASFEVDVVGGVPVVAAPEEIDISNAAELRTALVGAAALGRGTLVVDMSETEFCDSAGIQVLLQAHKRAQAAGGEFMTVLSATTVLRSFAISGVDRVIRNFPSLQEALAQARRSTRIDRLASVSTSPALTADCSDGPGSGSAVSSS